MNTPTLGIQLYTLRDYCADAKGLDETLGFVKEIGSDLVQISGIGKDEPIPAEKQKELLEKYGLTCCVTHTPFDRIINDTDRVIEEHKLINCRCVGLGAMAEEYRGTVENVDKLLSQLEPALQKLKAAGMTFNYHNHDFEFKPLDNGELIMDYLIEHTDPEVFHFTPDVAWIDFAGKDPVAYLKKMSGRVDVCHLKDYAIIDGERKFVTLGEGAVDLPACYAACKELDIPYIVYEQDGDWVDGDALKATRLSWEYMCKIAD